MTPRVEGAVIGVGYGISIWNALWAGFDGNFTIAFGSLSVAALWVGMWFVVERLSQ